MEKIKKLLPATKNLILILSVFAVMYLIIAEVFGVHDDEAFLYSIPVTFLATYLYQKHGS
ncbi:MAG: hypothetical protein HYT27_01265 [Parcubacteria group bacterium]|nr:hypothetical protein [Parcubacteria group bacterium]